MKSYSFTNNRFPKCFEYRTVKLCISPSLGKSCHRYDCYLILQFFSKLCSPLPRPWASSVCWVIVSFVPPPHQKLVMHLIQEHMGPLPADTLPYKVMFRNKSHRAKAKSFLTTSLKARIAKHIDSHTNRSNEEKNLSICSSRKWYRCSHNII